MVSVPGVKTERQVSLQLPIPWSSASRRVRRWSYGGGFEGEHVVLLASLGEVGKADLARVRPRSWRQN